MQGDDFYRSWERVLNPAILKEKIISFSVFITAFELLKGTITDKVEGFFIGPFDEDGKADYHEKVLSKNKSKMYASLIWLRSMHAITEEDFIIFEKLKSLRNKLSHEFFKLILEDSVSSVNQEIDLAINLLNKIEIWWFFNLDMAIDPDSYPADLDVNQVQPMSVWTLQLIRKVALGDEKEVLDQYQEFCERFRGV